MPQKEWVWACLSPSDGQSSDLVLTEEILVFSLQGTRGSHLPEDRPEQCKYTGKHKTVVDILSGEAGRRRGKARRLTST